MISVRVSQSSLHKFETCEEQFRLSRMYRRPRITPGSPMDEGLDAHAVMAGDKKKVSAKVNRYVSGLKKLEQSIGFKAIGREVTQTFDVVEGIGITRIIDALGYDGDGRPVLIDYKTTNSSRAWQPVAGSVPPLALSWQTVMYLLPPPTELIAPFEEWPTIINYLVTSPYEIIGVYGVERSKRREAELMEKLKRVSEYVNRTEMKSGVRTFGYHCGDCDFVEACYGEEGWEKSFVRRD